MKTTLITDEQTLVGATSRFGYSIPVYDDGYGPLFIHRDSMGITGIVRARTWEDAYSICEDEFFPAGDDEAAEEIQRIEAMPEGKERDHEQACFDESYGYRGSTRTMPDGTRSSVYAKDLNGDSLDILTPSLVAALDITLQIETPKEPEPEQRFHLWHLARRPVRGRIFVASWSGRYGTKGSSICAGYKGSRLVKHESYSPTWESDGLIFNP